MTEEEWLMCEQPVSLLDELARRMTARKLRLVYCACVRDDCVWRLLTSKAARRAIEVSEQFADGLVGLSELRKARTAAHRAWASVDGSERFDACHLVNNACWSDRALLRDGLPELREVVMQNHIRINAMSIRDIFGNPFRLVTFSPAWRTDTVISLARQMYDSRDFSAMPILADALQDAGCENIDLLNHCRAESVHVRGCWVVDLVLGKE